MTECTLLPGGVPYEYPPANADPGIERVAMARGARGNLSLAVALLITQWRTSERAPSGVGMTLKLAPPAAA